MNISLREEIDTKFFSFYLTPADEEHREGAPARITLEKDAHGIPLRLPVEFMV